MKVVSYFLRLLQNPLHPDSVFPPMFLLWLVYPLSLRSHDLLWHHLWLLVRLSLRLSWYSLRIFLIPCLRAPLPSSDPPTVPQYVGNTHSIVTRSKVEIFKPKALFIETFNCEPLHD